MLSMPLVVFLIASVVMGIRKGGSVQIGKVCLAAAR